MSDDGKCDSEIRSRIAMGKAAFGQIRTMLRNFGHRHANEDVIAQGICMVSDIFWVRELNYQQRNEEEVRGG